VSVVSHELRTPLTSIRGALGLMAGGVVGIIPDSAKKLVQLAYDNAERLSVLINDILDFEKLEYGGLLFTMENHNLWEMVREALEMNQGYAEKFGITCVLCTETDPGISVQVDRSRLLQVLSNLMSNAIKFSRAQGTVTLKLDLADDWVTVWVIDHGIGISARFRSQIFDKFSQEDGSVQRKYAGTGLGLSLAKSMIEKMHGRIGFESLEGHGASFYIALPIAAPSV
jgi:signal transduction histidine kinase